MQKVLSKREKIILILTVAIVIFSLAFNFLIGPLWDKNDALNREMVSVRLRLKKYLRLLKEKDALQIKYSAVSTQFNVPEAQSEALVGVLAELENIAKNALVRIVDIRPQSAAGSRGPYKEALIDLRTEAGMEGYIKFIYDIENSLSLLKIKRFQLSSQPNNQLLAGIFSISQLSFTE